MRKHQMEVYSQLERFNVLLAHRRFGKTVLAVMVSILENLRVEGHKQPQTFYYAPTFSQAKKVAWSYFKDYTRPMGATFNESELRVDMPNGGFIYLGSADNPDASRGLYAHHVVMDEPAQMPSRMFTEVIRPALSDHKGGLLMIGTPQGRHGLFYDKYTAAADTKGWNRFMLKASETGIIDDEELESAKLDMSKAEYAQEYECSWDAAIRGAYWAEAMNKAERAARIVPLVHDEAKQVYCAFDLGYNDATAIWFFQLDGDWVNLINYTEVSNMGLPDIVLELKKLPYNYGPMIFPHDVEVHGLNTGKTRKRILEDLGVTVIVAPKSADLIADIEVTRTFINKCRFDVSACKDGIEAVRHYRSEWSMKNSVLQLRPIHDWSSHSADSLRYLATTDLKKLDVSGWSDDITYWDS